jgi:hypothetical protein
MGAEYFAESEGTREAMFTTSFYGELGIAINKPIPIYGDNKGAVDYAKVQKVTQLSKHMDVKCHITREQYEKGTIDMIWIPSAENWADLFTKPLGPQLFAKIRDQITMIVRE